MKGLLLAGAVGRDAADNQAGRTEGMPLCRAWSSNVFGVRPGSDALFDRGMVGDLRRSLQG
jgi:hypothetical protein